jgi:hypothetical protein
MDKKKLILLQLSGMNILWMMMMMMMMTSDEVIVE